MGLRFKILSGFLILAIMLCVAGIWSIYELTTVGSSVQALLDDNYKSINAAKKMDEALERQDSGILVLLLGRWEEGRSIIESADIEFLDGLQIAAGNVTIPGEKAQVDEIRSKYGAFKELWTRPIVGTQHERNLDWYFNEVRHAFLDLKQSIEGLKAMNDRLMYQTASDLKNRAHRAVMPGIVAILSALIFTLIFNFFINFYMIGPIIKLADGIDVFLKTGAPFEHKFETKDELARLGNSIRELTSKLEERKEKE
jgi:HAMP domain-containing protein